MTTAQSVFFIAFSMLSLIWSPLQAQEAAEDPSPLHHQSADTCKLCHKEIYKAWRATRHAQSTPLKDPLVKAAYAQMGLDGRKEAQTTRDGAYPFCLNCHAPNAALDQKTRLDAMPAYAEGVNCVACHRLASYQGARDEAGQPRVGVLAYQTPQDKGAAEHLQGPNGFSSLVKSDDEAEVGNPHLGRSILYHGKSIPSLPLEANARQLKTANACLGCHRGYGNSNGISMCGIDEDLTADRQQADCQNCHMPLHEGLSDHGMAMNGGIDRTNLNRSLVLELVLEPIGTGVRVHVDLENRLPHALPSGSKALGLELKAYDAEGRLLWQGPADAPKTLFTQEFLDGQGRPVLPQLAEQRGRDTRLRPFEVRRLNVQIPQVGLALVRAELYVYAIGSGLIKAVPGSSKDPMARTLVGWAEARPGSSE